MTTLQRAHTHRSRPLTRGCPEDAIAHPKGQGLAQGHPEAAFTHQGGTRALNPGKLLWTTSWPKRRASHQTHCFEENHTKGSLAGAHPIALLDGNCGHRLVPVLRLPTGWRPSLLTKGPTSLFPPLRWGDGLHPTGVQNPPCVTMLWAQTLSGWRWLLPQWVISDQSWWKTKGFLFSYYGVAPCSTESSRGLLRPYCIVTVSTKAEQGLVVSSLACGTGNRSAFKESPGPMNSFPDRTTELCDGVLPTSDGIFHCSVCWGSSSQQFNVIKNFIDWNTGSE